MASHSRGDLLALTPGRYLAEGFLDPAGHPRPGLRATFATAACTQFAAAGLPPQELGYTGEAIKLLLPQYASEPPGARLQAAVEEALEAVARSIQQPNNEGLVQWLNECLPEIHTEADLAAFLDHMGAVTRQYAVMAAVLSSSEPALPG